jgi:DNA polymerase
VRQKFQPTILLNEEHSKLVEHPWGPHVTATIHPSAVLRAPDADRRHQEYRNFVDDLKGVRNALAAKK